MRGRLAIMARPRADDWLEVDIADWRTSGVDLVVSLLEKEEVIELGLEREAEFCRVRGIKFVSFPIPDRGVPDLRQALDLAHSIADGIAGGRSIAIHCRAGIGRSSVIAACAMICSGIEAGEALTLIREARGVMVPDTDEQRDWVMAFRQSEPGIAATGCIAALNPACLTRAAFVSPMRSTIHPPSGPRGASRSRFPAMAKPCPHLRVGHERRCVYRAVAGAVCDLCRHRCAGP